MSTTSRWLALAGIVALVIAAGVAVASLAPDPTPAPLDANTASAPSDAEVVVYRTPTCGCCSGWITHMRSNGYTVASVDIDTAELMVKKKDLGVPEGAASCHTAVIDGQVVEGHVPAGLVRKLRKERPDAAGLAVPGMPAGSPGMSGPIGDGYDVLLLEASGEATVFDHVRTDDSRG